MPGFFLDFWYIYCHKIHFNIKYLYSSNSHMGNFHFYQSGFKYVLRSFCNTDPYIIYIISYKIVACIVFVRTMCILYMLTIYDFQDRVVFLAMHFPLYPKEF